MTAREGRCKASAWSSPGIIFLAGHPLVERVNMLSGKLIQMIETHEVDISGRIVRAIRHDPGLAALAKLPDAELRECASEILRNLGHWLTRGNDEKLAREYENIAKARFEESVPLHESIRGVCLIKDKMIDFVDEQGIDCDSVALYAEEQLERHVGRFFDLLVIHLARGYEMAWRRAARAAA